MTCLRRQRLNDVTVAYSQDKTRSSGDPGSGGHQPALPGRAGRARSWDGLPPR